MLTRERPDFRTVDRWALRILLDAGAIHECDQHGWAKDRTDPHARSKALPRSGRAVAWTVFGGGGRGGAGVLDAVGDLCPEC